MRNTTFANRIALGSKPLTSLKLYHSIHARGENVDEILKAAERDDSALEATAQSGSADEDAGAHHQDASVDAPENTRYEDGEIGDYDMGEDRDLEPALLLDRGPGEASVGYNSI